MKTIAILATKNRFSLLKKAVESVICQTEKPDLLLVVSDSNEENFTKEKDYFKKINCIFLKDKYSHNYAGNLNTAIDFLILNKYDPFDTFIAFLDDDDYWDSNYLKKCNKYTEDIDFVVTGLRCDMDGNKYDLEIPSHLDIHDFLRGNPGIQGSNTFISFSTLLKAGAFDETMSSTTDRDLFSRVMQLNPRYKIINEYLVYVNSSNKRTRITNSSDIKKDGLSKFYFKYYKLMSKIDEEMFLKRANERFNLSKEELNSNLKFLQENKELHKGELNKFDKKYAKFFSCFNDVKQFEKLIGKENFSMLINKNYFDYFEEILKCYDILDSSQNESKYINKLTLMALFNDICDLNIKRMDVFKKYLDISKFIFCKCVRRCFIENKIDFTRINYDAENESRIRACIDFIRHIVTSKHTLLSFENIKNDLFKKIKITEFNFLGNGSEGVVFTDKNYIYKWFKNDDLELRKYLKKLSVKIKKCKCIYNFEVCELKEFLVIKYPFIEAKDPDNFKFNELENIIFELKNNGLCLDNIKKRNFVRDKNGLKYIDYGYSIVEYDNNIFERSLIRTKQLVEYQNCEEIEFYKLINDTYIKGERI